MIAVALAGIILLSVAPPYAALPVDVYARPAPAFDADPTQFLIDGLGGRPRESLVNVTNEANSTFVAFARYQGGVVVKVTRFNASNETAVSLAAIRAADYLDHEYPSKASASSSHACAKTGDKQWFVVDGAAGSQMAWRRANFVVEVLAPSPQVRDAMAAGLAI